MQKPVVLCMLMALVAMASGKNWTYIHQPGYCAMYSECGTSDTPTPGPMPCPYNGPAVNIPDDANGRVFRERLVEFCGERYATGPTCCDINQLESMIASLSSAYTFVANCPACWKNLQALWCEMTCHPDQSMYYNLTVIDVDPSGENTLDCVHEATFYVSPQFGEGLYSSCAETKFGMSNSPAMSFIGGGATDYIEMLEYMGEPKLMGSPYAIVFPDLRVEPTPPEFTPMVVDTPTCYDEGEYRCQCVDCSKSCPAAPPVESEGESCMVGSLECLPFALILTYAVALIISAVVAFLIHRRQQYEPLGAVTDDSMDKPKEWKLYVLMQRGFYKLGYFVARYPCTVILIATIIVGAMGVGLMNFQVEADPVELWVGPESESREQKAYFDEHFGPFYRTEQIIISVPEGRTIFEQEIFDSLFDIEAGAHALKATYNDAEVTLDQLCFKPLGDYCVVTSVTQYWQGDKDVWYEHIDNWYNHTVMCITNPTYPGGNDNTEPPCLPSYQDPLRPELAFGGFEGDDDYLAATAAIVTFVVRNSLDEEYISAATEWEKLFVEYMNDIVAQEKYINMGLRITYFTESGVELELARESTADLVTVAISYLVMFVYVSFALGRFVSWRRAIIDTKFTLGIAGVLICIFSVLAAMGIFSAFGTKTSLIIAEVIPFLVLAVGVDNIFILVNTFDSLPKNTRVEDRCAATLAEVGPSITLSAISETVAFALGVVVTMPAVNSFAAYSAVAVFVDYALQVTAFVALLALDARRTESKRIDCMPCVAISSAEDLDEETAHREGPLQRFFANYYASFVTHRVSRFVIVFAFLGLLVFGISYIPHIELGLDQSIALPSDSYLIPYFYDQAHLLKVGAPVYFVIRGGNATSFEGKQQLCASFGECNGYSVGNVLVQEAMRPEVSYLALNPANWMDDFISWLNPANSRCCRVRRLDRDQFCQSDENDLLCTTCYRQLEYSRLNLGPNGTEFLKYLDWYLQAIPSPNCPLAGAAAYSEAIVPDNETVTIESSHFRTYHTVLVTQADYINAYKNALRTCERVEDEYEGELDCYPYSLFYIYFEQYLTIVSVTGFTLAMAAVAVFLVTAIVLGSFVAAFFVVLPVCMIVANLAGVMALWKISLNAVSLVNLVMALGISVEFCSHIVRAYTISRGDRPERARKALSEIGASVFSGITVTKFLGVMVLAFAQSQIFVVYYFRMYITIVFMGFGHGLIFLPALLCYMGPASLGIGSEKISINSFADKQSRQEEQRRSIYGST